MPRVNRFELFPDNGASRWVDRKLDAWIGNSRARWYAAVAGTGAVIGGVVGGLTLVAPIAIGGAVAGAGVMTMIGWVSEKLRR